MRLVRKLYSGQLFRCAGFPNDDQFQPEMEPMYDDKATGSRITCGYRCPSFRAFSVLAGQPKRDWCLAPAISNAESVKP